MMVEVYSDSKCVFKGIVEYLINDHASMSIEAIIDGEFDMGDFLELQNRPVVIKVDNYVVTGLLFGTAFCSEYPYAKIWFNVAKVAEERLEGKE